MPEVQSLGNASHHTTGTGTRLYTGLPAGQGDRSRAFGVSFRARSIRTVLLMLGPVLATQNLEHQSVRYPELFADSPECMAFSSHSDQLLRDDQYCRWIFGRGSLGFRRSSMPPTKSARPSSSRIAMPHVLSGREVLEV